MLIFVESACDTIHSVQSPSTECEVVRVKWTIQVVQKKHFFNIFKQTNVSEFLENNEEIFLISYEIVDYKQITIY